MGVSLEQEYDTRSAEDSERLSAKMSDLGEELVRLIVLKQF